MPPPLSWDSTGLSCWDELEINSYLFLRSACRAYERHQSPPWRTLNPKQDTQRETSGGRRQRGRRTEVDKVRERGKKEAINSHLDTAKRNCRITKTYRRYRNQPENEEKSSFMEEQIDTNKLSIAIWKNNTIFSLMWAECQDLREFKICVTLETNQGENQPIDWRRKKPQQDHFNNYRKSFWQNYFLIFLVNNDFLFHNSPLCTSIKILFCTK